MMTPPDSDWFWFRLMASALPPRAPQTCKRNESDGFEFPAWWWTGSPGLCDASSGACGSQHSFRYLAVGHALRAVRQKQPSTPPVLTGRRTGLSLGGGTSSEYNRPDVTSSPQSKPAPRSEKQVELTGLAHCSSTVHTTSLLRANNTWTLHNFLS